MKQFDDEILELRKKRDAISATIKEKETERTRYYIKHVKDISLPFVNKAYKSNNDGSFLLVKEWNDERATLVAILYLPNETTANGEFKSGFKIYSTEMDDYYFRDQSEYSEITRDEFERLRDEFLKKHEIIS